MLPGEAVLGFPELATGRRTLSPRRKFQSYPNFLFLWEHILFPCKFFSLEANIVTKFSVKKKEVKFVFNF